MTEKYLTEEQAFPHDMHLDDPDLGPWVHRGHITEAAANRALEWDDCHVAPGGLTHTWRRYTQHRPDAACTADHCECGADEEGPWSETVDETADGAIAVTLLTARPNDEDELHLVLAYRA